MATTSATAGINLDQERTLALAAIFQAAQIAHQLARTGRTDSQALYTSLNSILITDADNARAIFGDTKNLRLGLKTLQDKFSNQPAADDLDLARYVISLIQLQSKIKRYEAVREAISRGIQSIKSQKDFFKSEEEFSLHPTIISKLAELYKQTVSTLAPRIIIKGDQNFLTSVVIADKIRAALLAGIRAGFLWHQLGGRRWHLLFRRGKIIRQTQRLLQENKLGA
ncbi:MAG: high frequency lysogenization protein HflD [Gammaproteobacteria bacterium]|nr:high frequency lysogenization protein HflD [Gammaproteobacteria bacterium]